MILLCFNHWILCVFGLVFVLDDCKILTLTQDSNFDCESQILSLFLLVDRTKYPLLWLPLQKYNMILSIDEFKAV